MDFFRIHVIVIDIDLLGVVHVPFCHICNYFLLFDCTKIKNIGQF